MAEYVELHSLLLSAHPHAPEWEPADGNAEPRHLQDRTIPVDLYQPVAWYAGTGTSREQAGTAEATGFVPSRLLFDALDLDPGKDFHWSDRGGVALADPTAGVDEASTLVMRRDLAEPLARSGYTLFWTVLLNKQRNDHTYNRPKKKYRWISASASYLLTDVGVDLLAAKAWVRKPVPGGDPKEIHWSVRASG